MQPMLFGFDHTFSYLLTSYSFLNLSPSFWVYFSSFSSIFVRLSLSEGQLVKQFSFSKNVFIWPFCVCMCVCICVLLGFELRALHLLSRHSVAWAMPSALFHFSNLPGQKAIDHDTTTYASCVAGIINMYHHAWLVSWDGGLTNFLPGLSSNCNPFAWAVFKL
jgi:hypothetical protein